MIRLEKQRHRNARKRSQENTEGEMQKTVCILNVPVTFEDIAVYFSEEEWEDLKEWQKELYKDVMKENYQTLISLGAGSLTVTPDIISHIEEGEEPYIKDELESEERETGKSSCLETDAHKMKNTETYHWELSICEGNKKLSEKEEEKISSHSDRVIKFRTGCLSAKKQRNSLRDLTENSTVCEQSGNGISHTEDEQRHQKPEQRCLCDVCRIFFEDPVTLRSEEKPSVCPESAKTFNHNEESEECERTRTTEPFKCSKCGDVFTRKGSLVQHQRIHTREIPGMVYVKPTPLKTLPQEEIHMRHPVTLHQQQRFHKEERPPKCIDYGKNYSQKGELHAQKRPHREMPFTCSKCGDGFSRKGSLVQHQAIHNRERAFQQLE
ncbi:zinc finger protein 250 [Microcaecilia unicolor]|uniref:Zinc finger protein 250-like n=1 Tax=Microcaecilia unicolor TaxID=1415580 RepID=A0A6P7XKR5_9AMPH|nr:zinc finger protein 250-like [Microcaecilia unicolor]